MSKKKEDILLKEKERFVQGCIKNRIPKDKAKHTYIKNHYNVEILYLWEDDIYNRLYLCKRLIKQYIKSKGILPNYHSFNYHIKHNKLELNENIILPYQDR